MTKKRFRNVRSVINTIFDIAVEKDIISVNYSRAVNINNFEFEREQTHYDEVYTKEEREKILTYLENRKNQTGYTRGIRLMFCFNCRLGEIKALTWDDVIETENGPMMYFRKQIVRRKCEDGHCHEVPLDYTKSRTASGDRMQPISERAMKVLNELRELGDTEGLICKNQRGKNLTTDRFNWVIKNACEATGVRYLSSNKMRFYSITEQVKAGKDISDIAYIAGHGSNFETTLGYIRQAHLNGQDLEEWDQIFG